MPTFFNTPQSFLTTPLAYISKRFIHPSLSKNYSAPVDCVQLIEDLLGDSNQLSQTAIELFHGTYQHRFSIERPEINAKKLTLADSKETTKRIARYLDSHRKVASKHSLFHMHFPGTHSLAMELYPEAFFRLYVTPPAHMHVSHWNWDVPFLRHPHRYNFISFPLVGSLINQRSIESAKGEPIWNQYRFQSAVTMGSPTLQPQSKIAMERLPFERCQVGEAYMMESPEIHRVGFLPDDWENDWSIVFFIEFRDKSISDTVYSRHHLSAVPEIEKLYKKPTQNELDSLIDAVCARLTSEPSVTPLI